MTGPRIVHKGQKAVQGLLKPVGKQARVSQTAKDLLEDVRITSCQFGNATDATDIAQKFVNMQMRMYELASHIELLERQVYSGERIVMKF